MNPGFRHLLAGLGAALLLAACGGGGGGGNDGDDGSTARPTANAGAAQTVEMGASVTLDGSASTSPTGASLRYQWTLAGKPANSQANLADATSARPSFVADKPGTYSADLVVSDNTASSTPSRVQVIATSPYPVANTAPRHSVRLGTETVGLDGTASTPPTGKSGSLTYLWTLKSRPASSLAALRDYDKGLATLVVDVEGEYVLQLVVSHEGQDSAPADVIVTVSAGNAPPVALADDVTVKLGDVVTLDASRSYDPDNQPLQYRWEFRHPTGAKPGMPIYVSEPVLQERTTARVRFTPEAAGDYHLDLFVFDGVWKSEVHTVKVTVEKPANSATNKPPVGQLVATGYYPSSSVGEQELGGRANFDFQGYDPEGEPLQLVSAELVSKPAGSSAQLENIGEWQPLGKKIQRLDVEGQYVVRVTVSDGVNQITSEASLTARIGGVNNRPVVSSLAPIAATALAGETLFFEATVRDPDIDPISYHWTLFDRPDGSAAAIVPIRDPNTREFSRAQVIADQPGNYTVRLDVEDDRGLRSMYYTQTQAMAKRENNPPTIREVLWRDVPADQPWSQFQQLLPCMRLTFSPVAIDPDGDKLYVHRDLIQAPAGGNYGQNHNNGCPTNEYTFNLPGEYVFRYLASDGIAETAPYDFTVRVEPQENARGVELALLFGDMNAPLYTTVMPWPSVRNEAGGTSVRRTEPVAAGAAMSLRALDGNYTITDVKAVHVNGNVLTPWFEGIQEGQVLQQGVPVKFRHMLPAMPCGQRSGEEKPREVFQFSFGIKELPGFTYLYDTSMGLDYDNNHPSCQ